MGKQKCRTKHWYFSFRCSKTKSHNGNHYRAGCSWTDEVDDDTALARGAYVAAHPT